VQERCDARVQETMSWLDEAEGQCRETKTEETEE
ncbi:hypothetical protein LCGC14_2050830, partial [marine sediment metagenome]